MRYLLLALFLSLLSCLSASKPLLTRNFDECYQLVYKGKKVKIPDNGFLFKVSGEVSPKYYQDIIIAANAWNRAFNRHLIKVTFPKDNFLPTVQDGNNVISFKFDWPDGSTKENARAQQYLDLDGSYAELYEVDIIFNFAYHSFVPGLKFREVMMHEFGHALGFEHHHHRLSIMYSFFSSDREMKLSFDLPTIDQQNVQCVLKSK